MSGSKFTQSGIRSAYMPRICMSVALALSLSGCIGTAVSVATDVVTGTAGLAIDATVGAVDITTDVVGTAVGAVIPGSGDDESDD